ncbi:hypothetical protein [Nostoc sp.]
MQIKYHTEQNVPMEFLIYQDLRNCHKQWRGVAVPRAKQLGNKDGNIRAF